MAVRDCFLPLFLSLLTIIIVVVRAIFLICHRSVEDEEDACDKLTFQIPTLPLKIRSHFVVEWSLSLSFVLRDVKFHPSLLTLESSVRELLVKNHIDFRLSWMFPSLSLSTRLFSCQWVQGSSSNDTILLSSRELFGRPEKFMFLPSLHNVLKSPASSRLSHCLW